MKSGATDNGGKDTAGVIAPPPVIYLAFLLIGLGADRLWPAAVLSQGPRYAAGIGVIALGLALGFAAVREFRRHNTSVKPHEPATALITGGPYRYSRNPIYLGASVMYIGAGIAVNSVWPLALFPVAVLLVLFRAIRVEERYLETKFGQPYRDYKSAVRRWL